VYLMLYMSHGWVPHAGVGFAKLAQLMSLCASTTPYA
jgi:hypothetical protein